MSVLRKFFPQTTETKIHYKDPEWLYKGLHKTVEGGKKVLKTVSDSDLKTGAATAGIVGAIGAGMALKKMRDAKKQYIREKQERGNK